MATALRRFAAHHGKHGLYHETVTAAFLALIHQRMAEDLAAQGQKIARAGAQTLDWEGVAAHVRIHVREGAGWVRLPGPDMQLVERREAITVGRAGEAEQVVLERGR